MRSTSIGMKPHLAEQHDSLLRMLAALLTGIFLSSAALAAGADDSAENRSRPNIVFILADDLGWTDLGCMGSRYYETPHIDRLAEQGMVFSSFYACQNCAPTRAALISGQYAPRTGIYTVGTPLRGRDQDRKMVPPENSTRLPLDKLTIAEVLRGAGYATGMFGKWHLGNGGQYHPARRGFDQAIVTGGRHFQFRTSPAVPVEPGQYLADFLTDQAVAFIRAHQNQPFFLYLPHYAVHVPLEAKDEWIAKYREKEAVGGHRDPVYAAMIHSLDESVGRVLATLDQLDLAENTLVIFTSDNGGLGSYEVPDSDETKGITDNAPLRGGKGTLYEGGIRVPFVARWPAVIPAQTKCDQPSGHIDVLATLAELAGAEVPADHVQDGISLAPLLARPDQPLDRPALYWHMPGYLESYIEEAVWRTTPVSVIRRGDYKLLEFFEDGRLELYNLPQDIGEERDLSGTQPELARQLRDELIAWRKATEAALPRGKTAEELARPRGAGREGDG